MVRYDPAVHVKVAPSGRVGPGWVVHVSLEVPLQRVQAQILVHNRVPVRDPVPVQSFGIHRMEVLSSVVPWVGHSEVPMEVRSKVRMVAPSEGCGPVVHVMVALVEVVLERVVPLAFHPHPHHLHQRCPEEPCHRKVCNHLSK